MKTTNKIIIAVLIIAVLLVSIGYAAIQNITLNISGTASGTADDANFKVKFLETTEVSDSSKVTATVTNDTNAAINVVGVSAKGQIVTATYTVQNVSTDLSANLSVNTTNNNEEYFAIESNLGKTSLVAGEVTTLTVTVEVIKTPITTDEVASIGIGLVAEPVQPGEEGTTLIPGTPEGTTGLEQNEFGFYFDQPYSVTIEGVKQTAVFYEDTSLEMYIDGILAQQVPAGVISYDSFSIDGSALDYGILTVSTDGRQIYFLDGTVLELDFRVPKGAVYVHINDLLGTAVIYYDIMPATVRVGDVYIYGDYYYTYSSVNNNEPTGWSVYLLTADDVSMLSAVGIEIECGPTDRNQTSYEPILESINGEPITTMHYTFEECTSLTTAPKIPSDVWNMEGTFKGCTSLTTAPEIPSGVMDMVSTFNGCTSLTTAPEIPSGVMDMSATFVNCTALTIAPKIPSSVMYMYATFSSCTGLTTAPEIPSSVTNMAGTFRGCTSLTGTVEINTNNINRFAYGGYTSGDEGIGNDCFKNVDMSKITLTGEASKEVLNLLGSTGENYTPIT